MFYVGRSPFETPHRTNPHPDLQQNQRAPSLFSSPRFTRVRLSRLARSSQRTSRIANSPTRPAIRTRSPPFLPPDSDPRHTPPPCSHVRQAAPLFSPSSTCLVLLFSQVHLIVLFCLGSTRLPAITDGADQTTDGCGAVGTSDIRSRSTSTSSSGRSGGTLSVSCSTTQAQLALLIVLRPYSLLVSSALGFLRLTL